MGAQDKVYKVITDQVLALLEQGTVPWRCTWQGIHHNLESKRAYRGINPFLLNAAGRSTTWWVTYTGAQRLGGNVMSGEKSTVVLLTRPIMEKDDPEEIAYWLVRYFRVFNLDQTEGISPEKIPAVEKSDLEPVDAAEAFVEGYSDCPPVFYGSASASYSPSKDEVRVPSREQQETSESFYATLFHELTHSTGHESRLGRHDPETATRFGSDPYAREELIAEMGSAFVMGTVGLEQPVLENSAAYIQNWLQALQNDKRLVVVAASSAQAAVEYMQGKRKE